MRKLLIGGIALLSAMLLNAEDTKVFSYNGKIDDQMNKITEGSPNVKAQETDKKYAERENEKGIQQEKWNNLSDAQKTKIKAQRMEKRDEGRAHITNRINDLNNESQKLSNERADGHGLDKDQYDHKQSVINEKKAALMEMKAKLERAPSGQNVDLDTSTQVESPRLTVDETPSRARH